MSLSILQYIDNGRILGPEGILIVEERFNIRLPETLKHLQVVDKRVYGENAFWLYQLSIPCPVSGIDNTTSSPINLENTLP